MLEIYTRLRPFVALRYEISRGESRNEPFCCPKRLSPSSVISRQIECHCGTPSAHDLNRCRSVVSDMPQYSSDQRLREHRKQSLASESECVTRGTRRCREREIPETAGSEALTSQSPGWSGPVPRALASPVSVHNIKSISESCTLLNILYKVKSLNLYGLGE